VESKRVNTEVNAVGETFGKLTVTEVSWREDRWHSVAWANGTCECGNTFESRLADLKNGTTRTCGCGTHVSGIEEEFVSFLQDLAPVRPQYRIGRRVFDAALPDRNLLFEFNGVYWHSYPRTKRAAHADKRRAAEDLGFRVIYVWEDQWLYRTQQVKDYLERVLLGAKRKIGARQLIPHDVPRTDAVAFHEQFHLQGFKNTISTLHFGLSSKQGELQAVASFSPDGTLHRYTVRSGVSVAGGLPRMVKAFSAATPTASKVITFCDRDHFSGGVYEQAGFQKTGHSLTMSYVQRRRRLRREHFQKHKLPGIFNDVDMSQREIDICAANSIYACWNSGVDRYELSLRT
jgi:very-short-patch-repair endonuclease